MTARHPAAEEVIDCKVFDQLSEAVGADRVGRMLRMYLADAHNQVAAIQAAGESGDMDSLCVRAHSLKGTSANLGIASCRDHATAIVQACTKGRTEDARARAAEMPRVLEVAAAVLAVHLPSEHTGRS